LAQVSSCAASSGQSMHELTPAWERGPCPSRESYNSDESETNDSPSHPQVMEKRSATPGSGTLSLGQTAGCDRLRQQFGPSPLAVLSLKKEHLLDTTLKRFAYHVVVSIARCVPAMWIYGGTVGLSVCIIFRYRWGVLESLGLFTTFTTFHCLNLIVHAMLALFAVWTNSNKHWHAMCCKELEMKPMQRSGLGPRQGSGNDLQSLDSPTRRQQPWSDSSLPLKEKSWQDCTEELCNPSWEDVFHVVIIAAYKTPEEYLMSTVERLLEYSQASTHMGVVLALEQREAGCQEKGDRIKEYFQDRFKFVTYTVHPANMANHIRGKASNMCWSFQEMTTELCQYHGFTDSDQYRIIVTNMDDDTEMHENYFEALTYHFLKAAATRRYLTIWQPPVAHFKNLATQPALIRVGAMGGSLADLARHANSMDCHTPFSSNSMSLVLALAVGGWDPDWVSDDWHMMAKCTVMTEGRCRCESIMLPMVNLMPEEDDCCGTMKARWTQVKRHALGVSEVVYLVSSIFLGLIETPTFGRKVRLVWRTLPLLAKFIEVHFVGSLLAIWPPLTAVLITCTGTFWATDISEDQVVFNSMLAQYQRNLAPIIIGCILAAVPLAVVYVNLLKHRLDNNQWPAIKYPLLLLLRSWQETMTLGWFQQVIFGSIPEWIAATRIIFQLKIDHAVAAMIGRPDMGEGF